MIHSFDWRAIIGYHQIVVFVSATTARRFVVSNEAKMTFEKIYLEFETKLRYFILGRISDPELAEDILQDVFLKIHSNIGSVKDSEKLESWIYQITRNAIIDSYRRSRPEDELSESLPALQEEEPDAAVDLAASVQEMLNCIPAKDKQALTLTEIQGMTQTEMANELGITVSGAKSRVQRAREKLKDAFLDCCHFEFDRFNKVIQYEPKCSHCAGSSPDCRDESRSNSAC